MKCSTAIFLLVLQLILLAVMENKSDGTLCITSTSEIRSTHPCDRNSSQELNASSLTDIAEFAGSHFHLCCVFSVNKFEHNVTFSNKDEIVIHGNDSESTIQCQGESGLTFTNVNKVEINNLIISNCGRLNKDDGALNLRNVNNSNITKVTIINSTNTGITIDNCVNVSITRSKLMNNKGVGIHFHSKPPNTQSQVVPTTTNISISDCLFMNNTGHWYGGAILANFTCYEAENVTFSISNSNFSKNTIDPEMGGSYEACRGYSGGGIAIITSNTTIVHVLNSSFSNNIARCGAGLYINRNGLSIVDFKSCTWEANSGVYGSAIMVECTKNRKENSIHFTDCTFKENKIWHATNNYYKHAKGALYSKKTNVRFMGDVLFEGNEGGGIYMISNNITINENANVTFTRNTAYLGGAIALLLQASIQITPNSTLTFDSNMAMKGGAIYQGIIDFFEYSMILQKCFVICKAQNCTNAIITFINNTAIQGHGNSIYLSSIVKLCGPRDAPKKNYTEILNGIATFNFQHEEWRDEIETLGQYHNIRDSQSMMCIVPGKRTEIDIDIWDDIGKINSDSKAIMKSGTELEVDPAYYITNNTIIIRGSPGKNGTLQIYLLPYERYVLNINITIQECPPGFIIDDTTKTCKCSLEKEGVKAEYNPIKWCDTINFDAYLRPGYWAGYIHNLSKCYDNSSTRVCNTGYQEDFYTSICPLFYCAPGHESKKLTGKNKEELSKLVCAENRMGIMCGSCVKNYTVFFHDHERCCQETRSYLCHVGGFFYILSELLPATIFFMAIILLNITFTSGSVSGFIFYAQILTIMVRKHHIIVNGRITDIALKSLQFVTQIFNLSFFPFTKLSFCLWKNASALDMIAFNYVTILYCFFLVLVTTAVMNRCFIKLSLHCGVDKSQLFHSVIKGLSSFLILCYFQTTKVSMQLLSFSKVGNDNRMYYQGDIKLNDPKYRIYAIPAILFLSIITFPPPILLICYPLCYKVLSIFRLQESKFAKILCRVIPLDKYKPWFDIFQSSYRDEHRYFAGLYFIYRMSILSIHVIVKDFSTVYTFTEIQLILMLTVHSLVYPHTKRWHNRLDAIMIMLLACINGLGLYNFMLLEQKIKHDHEVNISSTILIFLAWIPLCYMLIYTIVIGTARAKKHLALKRIALTKDRAEISTSNLLDMEQERNDMFELSYKRQK